MPRFFRLCAGALTVLTLLAAPTQAAPKVVVSVAPVHSLVAGVMAGVGEPRLLLPASASPHEFTLRPSDARALAEADIVFRVGAALEPSLDKPLAALAQGTVVTLADAPGIAERLIASEDVDDDHQADGESDARNPHFWLSVGAARRIAETAARSLSEHDRGNADIYRRNLARLNNRLDLLETGLRERVKSARQFPYVVLHDAYSYFEAEFGLRRTAAISISPERRPGARRLREIRDLLAAQDVRCVFAEPQFPQAIADTVIEGTNARLAELDPLGIGIAPGSDLYFTLMENLGRALAGCLSR